MKGGEMNKPFTDLPILMERVGMDYVINSARDAGAFSDLKMDLHYQCQPMPIVSFTMCLRPGEINVIPPGGVVRYE